MLSAQQLAVCKQHLACNKAALLQFNSAYTQNPCAETGAQLEHMGLRGCTCSHSPTISPWLPFVGATRTLAFHFFAFSLPAAFSNSVPVISCPAVHESMSRQSQLMLILQVSVCDALKLKLRLTLVQYETPHALEIEGQNPMYISTNHIQCVWHC